MTKTADLIRVAQLPVIEESLRTLKSQVDEQVKEAMSLVCTTDTVQTVKNTRAALRKDWDELETQRKAVKAAVLGPYEKFEAVYKECVSNAYKTADASLKGKIDALESELKAECDNRLKAYFDEKKSVEGLNWLDFERFGIHADLAAAKQKTPKKFMDRINVILDSVKNDVDAIAGMPDAAELMAEYKATLNLAQATKSVRERHERIDAEMQAKKAREAAEAAQRAAVTRVNEAVYIDAAVMQPLAPPTAENPGGSTEYKDGDILPDVYICTFTVTATKEQLRRIKQFLTEEGIKYE